MEVYSCIFGSVECQFDICGYSFEMTQSEQLCEFLLRYIFSVCVNGQLNLTEIGVSLNKINGRDLRVFTRVVRVLDHVVRVGY